MTHPLDIVRTTTIGIGLNGVDERMARNAEFCLADNLWKLRQIEMLKRKRTNVLKWQLKTALEH